MVSVACLLVYIRECMLWLRVGGEGLGVASRCYGVLNLGRVLHFLNFCSGLF